jgi:hypothetical protein
VNPNRKVCEIVENHSHLGITTIRAFGDFKALSAIFETLSAIFQYWGHFRRFFRYFLQKSLQLITDLLLYPSSKASKKKQAEQEM